MPIKFNCPACAAAIKAPETHAGETLPCPKCEHAVTVPAAELPDAPQAEVGIDVPPDIPPQFPPTDASPVELELPEIVTGADTPPPAPTSAAATPPLPLPVNATNAFVAPQTDTRPAIRTDLTDIRIVDFDIPFWSIFKFTLKFLVSASILTVAFYAIAFVILLVFAAVFGIGVSSIGP